MSKESVVFAIQYEQFEQQQKKITQLEEDLKNEQEESAEKDEQIERFEEEEQILSRVLKGSQKKQAELKKTL